MEKPSRLLAVGVVFFIRAIATGNFTAKSADELAVQLRGGASASP